VTSQKRNALFNRVVAKNAAKIQARIKRLCLQYPLLPEEDCQDIYQVVLIKVSALINKGFDPSTVDFDKLTHRAISQAFQNAHYNAEKHHKNTVSADHHPSGDQWSGYWFEDILPQEKEPEPEKLAHKLALESFLAASHEIFSQHKIVAKGKEVPYTEVFGYLGRGYTPSEISRICGTSPSLIAYHTTKLKAHMEKEMAKHGLTKYDVLTR
jgi:DNA-directed RNA polymerase specialized sigma24 family protein